mgnify:CR=1 FL=1
MGLAAAAVFTYFCGDRSSGKAFGILYALHDAQRRFREFIDENSPVDAVLKFGQGALVAFNEATGGALGALMSYASTQVDEVRSWLKRTGAVGYVVLALVMAKILLSVIRA